MGKLSFLAGALLLLSVHSILANHTADFQWMGWCCGQKDCIVVPVNIIAFQKDEVRVMVNGVELVLPQTTVRESEDGHTYWCRISTSEGINLSNTRCVFYTVGG